MTRQLAAGAPGLVSPAASAALLTALLTACLPDGSQHAEPATTAIVVRVIDGDTVDVDPRAQGGRTTSRVRLLGIDAPEVAHRRQDTAECYGPEATRTMVRALPVGTSVTLIADPTQPSRDSHGRLLRYVEISGPQPLDVGRLLVSQGAARVRPGTPTPSRNRGYRELERSAENHDRGLWRICVD